MKKNINYFCKVLMIFTIAGLLVTGCFSDAGNKGKQGVDDEVVSEKISLGDEQIAKRGLENWNAKDGLVLYYNFDTSSLEDSSDNKISATGSGIISYATGIKGKALKLNGKGNIVSITHSALKLNGNVSICLWLNSDDGNYNVLKNGGNNIFSITGTGSAIYSHSFKDVTEKVKCIEIKYPSFPKKEWHFISFTRDDDKKTLKLFIDSKKVYETEYAETPNVEDFYNNLVIGANIDKDGTILSRFKGMLDEIRIYNNVLSEEAILQLYRERSYNNSNLQNEVANIMSIQEEAYNQLNQISETDEYKKVEKLLLWVKERPNVAYAELNGKSEIEVEYVSGIKGSIELYKNDSEGSEIKSFKRALAPSNVSNVTIANNKVLIYSPFYDEFGDMTQNVEKILKNGKANMEIDFLKNQECTVDILKNINKYGLILFHTHGGANSLVTGEIATYLKLDKNLMLLNNELELRTRGTLNFGIWKYDFHNYAFTGKFVKNKIAKLKKGTIVYAGACNTGIEVIDDTYIPKAFINKGASCYLGFTNSVTHSFDSNITTKFFNLFINELNTVEEAYNYVKDFKDDSGAYLNLVEAQNVYIDIPAAKNFKAVADSQNKKIILSWEKNNGILKSVDGYYLYRAIKNTTDSYIKIKEISSDENQYEDLNLLPGKYYYKLYSYIKTSDTVKMSLSSNINSEIKKIIELRAAVSKVSTIYSAQFDFTFSEITFIWENVDKATKYEILRKMSTTESSVIVTSTASITGFKISEQNVFGKSPYYKIVAKDSLGKIIAESNFINLTVPDKLPNPILQNRNNYWQNYIISTYPILYGYYLVVSFQIEKNIFPEGQLVCNSYIHKPNGDVEDSQAYMNVFDKGTYIQFISVGQLMYKPLKITTDIFWKKTDNGIQYESSRIRDTVINALELPNRP